MEKTPNRMRKKKILKYQKLKLRAIVYNFLLIQESIIKKMGSKLESPGNFEQALSFAF